MDIEPIEPGSPPDRRRIINELETYKSPEKSKKDRSMSDNNINILSGSRMFNEIGREHLLKPMFKNNSDFLSILEGVKTSKKNSKMTNMQSSPNNHQDNKTKSGKKQKKQQHADFDDSGNLMDTPEFHSSILLID